MWAVSTCFPEKNIYCLQETIHNAYFKFTICRFQAGTLKNNIIGAFSVLYNSAALLCLSAALLYSGKQQSKRNLMQGD